MIRHIVLWQHQDEFNDEERAANLSRIKEGLEGLVGVVPGLVSATVYTQPLDSSNRSWMLDSTLENREALAGYKVHPAHKAVSAFVHQTMQNRVCFDAEV